MWAKSRKFVAKLVALSLFVVLLGAAPASARSQTTCEGHPVTIYAEDVLSYEFPDILTLLGEYVASEGRVPLWVLNDYKAELESYKETFARAKTHSEDPFNGPVVVGTPGNDVILGTDGAEWIVGLGGDDIICGLKGDDFLTGGRGIDRLRGGAGRDKLSGGNTNEPREALYGGRGRDTLVVNTRCRTIVQETDATIDGGEILASSGGCSSITIASDGSTIIKVGGFGAGSNIWWA